MSKCSYYTTHDLAENYIGVIQDENSNDIIEYCDPKFAEQIVSEHNTLDDSMTSVIHWTRYDGTEETLPENNGKYSTRPVLAAFGGQVGQANLRIEGVEHPSWTDDNFYTQKIEIGDMWAYLPTTEGI